MENFNPGVPFHGRPGEEINFRRGRWQYKVAFTQPGQGIQENLRTGTKRRIRCIEAPASSSSSSSSLRRSGTLAEHLSNLQMLRNQLLMASPQIKNESHPAHAMLKRAEAAEKDQRWEVAFNEIFSAQEALSQNAEPTGSAGQRSIRGRKRSVSGVLAEAMGESTRVARRLLDEEEGDEANAFQRALLIRDLEEGNNNFKCQVEMNRSPVDCLICTDQVQVREALRFQPCHHGWYCVPCIQQTVDAKIAEGATVGTITCLECKQALSEALLRALLTNKQLERLHRQSLEYAVSSCSELRPCPTPYCPNRVVLEDGVRPRLLCEFCHKDHCLLCSASPYHEGKTCEEHLRDIKDSDAEVALRRWMTQVGAKQCPTCKAVVTKQNLGKQQTQDVECHKMICRACKTRFCFGCLTVLTEDRCGCTGDNHGFIDPETGAFVADGMVKRRRR